jgi:hypothetical protein
VGDNSFVDLLSSAFDVETETCCLLVSSSRYRMNARPPAATNAIPRSAELTFMLFTYFALNLVFDRASSEMSSRRYAQRLQSATLTAERCRQGPMSRMDTPGDLCDASDMVANVRVQRPPADALKCALYRSLSACNEMLGFNSAYLNMEMIARAASTAAHAPSLFPNPLVETDPTRGCFSRMRLSSPDSNQTP